ncbi:hypothetical protein CIB43_00309 [Mesomycoplasma hyopneumoniae]|uniref:Uncharacterized protein n=1 Tax=Mesomycoplasma hyopneumoniae TaxID=2099 RepID=A0A223M9I1_MESHO|nr:hypothetical protein CIB43_00309 [Mesomycoplasma hyopneumoniae]
MAYDNDLELMKRSYTKKRKKRNLRNYLVMNFGKK